ncbi:MAG: hypothetical protein ABSH32_06805 [Bryobacteraceae bacterium]
MTLDGIWNWLQSFLSVGAPLILLAFGLFKWFGQKWIEQRLVIGLEKFKAGQQNELEEFKSEQQKELERLRHRLSSRISKIHEKEFEVLPKSWLMLNDLHGSVALALDLTFKIYPDFRMLPGAQFEEFLTVSPASRLSDYQKEALRKLQDASDRRKYFTDAMAGINFDDAKEKQRIFHNYLIENRIFMTAELREKFGMLDRSLSTLLTNYSVQPAHSAQSDQEEVNRLKNMIDEVEQLVQERLHYEEA